MEAVSVRPKAMLLEGTIDEPPALGRLVRDRLRRAVMNGEIRPGVRLRQVALAEELGVSRMPVRDAISALVAESLLVEAPGGGAVVPALTSRDVEGLLSVREILERRALEEILGSRAVGELLLGDLNPLEGDGAAARHVRFHRTLCDSAGNRYLSSALASVWPTLERVMAASPELAEELADSDDALRRTVHIGRHDRAIALLERQFSTVRHVLLAHPSTGQELVV